MAINGAFSQLPAGSTKAGCSSLAQFRNYELPLKDYTAAGPCLEVCLLNKTAKSSAVKLFE